MGIQGTATTDPKPEEFVFCKYRAKNSAFLPSGALYQVFELQALSCKCMHRKSLYFIKLGKFSFSAPSKKKKIPPHL